MRTKEKLTIGAIICTIFVGMIYLIKSVLAPFICSLVIAYFLDPLVDYLTDKHKIKRPVATALILGLFLSVFVSASAILLPVIYTQTAGLIDALPKYFHIIIHDFYPQIVRFLGGLGINLDNDLSRLMTKGDNSYFVNISRNFFVDALSSSVTFINVLSLIFITPILVFYLLKDWDILMEKTYGFLPKFAAKPTKEIAQGIDRTLAGYVRGQFNVCLILAIFYSISLSFAGLNFGFLIGFLTGMLAFIPFVGMLIGVSAATIVALFQWGFDVPNLALVATIFLFAQIVESNFLTPKLVGDKIGLHPVWLIFGLFVFGTLLGFIGVLLAVPLSAICGVIIKYFSLRYKEKFGL